MRMKCPSCHAEFDAVSALDGTAGSELMLLLAGLDKADARPLLSYLSLFRSKTRALSWDRALRLAKEVQAIAPNQARLTQGLVKACDVLSQKRQQSGWKPLTNHNYLRRVLDDLPEVERNLPAVTSQEETPRGPQLTSKTSAAFMQLEALKSYDE